MRRLPFLPLAVLCALVASSAPVAQSPASSPFRGLLDHVTTTVSGGVANTTSEGGAHSISGDGRYVVFSSGESQLVTDDFNWNDDVFLRDRTTGMTTRISVNESGGDSDGLSQMPAISTDGRHVAFASGAANLVSGDSNDHWDVFVRDLDANHTVRISVATDGSQGDADSYSPSVSADGRYVTFISSSTTFAPGITQYGPTQIYLHDRDLDGNGVYDDAGGTATSLVSIGIDMQRADQDCVRARVSADGRYVMFESGAANLDPAGNPNGNHHLYLRDRQTGANRLIDRAVTGGPSAWGINWQASDMSDDGRFITYSSVSHDIVPFDMNWISQVFLHDTTADPAFSTSVISRTGDGALADGSSYYTTVSADGRFVGFATAATNLTGPLTTYQFGLVVRDTTEETVTRVDVLDGGVPFDGQALFNPSLSADGTAIAFQSDAANAAPGGSYPSGVHRIFVATAFSASPLSATFVQDGGSGSIEINTTAVSGWTAESQNDWIVLMDGGGFGAGPRTVQYLISPNPAGIVRNGRIRVGSTFVAVHQEGDGDTTPPVITPIVTGTQVNGWYTSDITVRFEVTDPDSEIVEQSYNCTQTLTFTTDFLYAAPACEATSHGGIATVTIPLRRDTTPPNIWFVEPKPAIYPFGVIAYPSYQCYDSYSETTTCSGPSLSTPLDTWTRGRNTFTVTATDEAGNTATQSVEYLVGVDQCVAMPSAPANLKRWLKFDGNLRDSILGLDAAGNYTLFGFQAGVAGQAWFTNDPWTHLWAWDSPSVLAGPAGLTIAMWARPQGWHLFNPIVQYQTLVFNPMQYHVARWNDGTLRWAFNTTNGFTWVNTGVTLSSAWQHVAVTYNDGVVQTFINGSVVHSQPLSGTLTTGPNTAGLQIGGRSGLNNSFKGAIDDVMIFDAALPASDIDNLALSGSGSLCSPFASNLTLTVPPAVTAGPYFEVTALLTDASGRPIPNRPLTITSAVSPPAFIQHVTTNASGSASATFPVTGGMAGGVYDDAIVATFDGDDAFTSASAQSDITVIGTPPLSWLQPANITYGTPLGPDQLRATSTVPGTYVYSPPAGTVLDAGVHMLSVTFTPTDTAYYTSNTLETMLLVVKATPSVEIASPPLVYSGQPRQATVTVHGVGGAALNPFTVLYNGAAALPVNAGTYAVQVSYGGSANYHAVSASGSLVINKATPILGTLNDITGTYNGQPWGANVNIAGVAGEWLTPVIQTYNGSTELPVDAGVYAAVVQYDGSVNYHAITRTYTVTVLKAVPYLQWANPSSIVYGTPLGAVQLNPTSDVAGTFTYLPPAGTVLNAGSHTLEATFTPSDSTNYASPSISRPISVSKATANPVWYRPADVAYGTALGASQLNATAGVPGAFAYTPAAGTVLPAGEHVLSVTFTPEDAANYNGGSALVPFTVLKAASAISWPNPSDIVYGAALGAAQLNATANVAGTFSYSPATGAVLNAGSHTLSVTFTPDDAANYDGASANVTLNVNRAASTISWANPSEIVYGAALGAAQLNATANVAGTFSYSPATGAVLSAGSHTLSVTFTPDDAANYHGGSANVPLTVTKAASTVNWSSPAGIVYGTALGASQLNATANVAGTFSYSPAAGTVLNAGTHQLSVTFTPADAANYTSATGAAAIVIAPRALTVQANNAAKVYGAALPAFTASGVGFVNGDSMSSLAGTLTFTTSATATSAPGSYSVTPSGVSSANYAITFANGTLTVTKAATAITFTTTPNPSNNNQTVQLRAVVSAVAPGAGTATGTVQFRENGTLLGTATLVNGVATMNKSFKRGTHPLTATYAGNTNFTGSSASHTHQTQ